MNEPHIEVKAWKTKKIDSTKAKEIRDKDSVIGVVTTGGITKPAKEVFNEADIAWIEYFPEKELTQTKAQEEG
ncbi:hypothetical protein [Argonema galeatum]|uniref:hypothetical protein n=1 Tax=Argonema galeatum TaxID=2942762 RepID=UPI002011B8A3|nr:hypothetical protein [Argonema galeatum]MCL1468241.1 hypothetical protein [Argonema galeatum A003/A1]